jgi:hypothetical protein
MGTTLDRISTYLDQYGLTYQGQPEKSRILIQVSIDQDEKLLVVIQLDEEADFLSYLPQKSWQGCKNIRIKLPSCRPC